VEYQRHDISMSQGMAPTLGQHMGLQEVQQYRNPLQIVYIVVVVVVVKGNARNAPANNTGEGGDETEANWDPENRCPGRLAFTGCACEQGSTSS
jgi:hypothetical protein